MTAVESRRERKKMLVRSRILSTAIKLFSHSGLEAVTIDEIAVAADVGKGTVYNYFATNEHRCSLHGRSGGEHGTRDQPFRAGEAAVHRARPTAASDFRLKEPYHAFVRVFLAQMFMDTDRFLPYMVEIRNTSIPPQSLFATFEKRGLLRADIDISQLIMSFKTMHLGLTALWAVESPPFQQTSRWFGSKCSSSPKAS